MDLDQLIKRILSAQPNLTREAVLNLILEKRVEAGELLTDEGAAYIIAAELGVSLHENELLETEIRLANLLPGTRDISVTGRILTIYPVRRFTRSNGAEGQIGRLILADKTGTADVVLWDDKADLISQGKLAKDQIIRIAHGYVREGLDGTTEINVGSRGQVILSPSVSSHDLPQLKDFFKKIGELREEENRVNTVGVVGDTTPTITFRRGDEVGRLTRVKLIDETGDIWAVFWNEMTESLTDLKRGDRVEVVNARTRRNIQDSLELHVGKRSQVTISTEERQAIDHTPLRLTKISELRNTSRNVNVLARVVDVDPVREFKRPSGEMGRVASAQIEDDTGVTKLVLWGEHASVVGSMSVNDMVMIQNAYVRDGLQGSIELNLGRLGKITVNHQPPNG
jgi:replication factor A1